MEFEPSSLNILMVEFGKVLGENWEITERIAKKTGKSGFRKHPTRQFLKYLFLRVWSPGKSYVFLTKFWESISWKVWSVLMVVLSYGKNLMCSTNLEHRYSGKFDRFLWYLFLLENCIYVFLQNFDSSPGKFICVSVPFLINLLDNLTCSYERIISSPGKFEVFLLHPSLLENLMSSRNLFKKVAQIFCTYLRIDKRLQRRTFLP